MPFCWFCHEVVQIVVTICLHCLPSPCRDDYIRMKWEELMGKLEQRKFTLDGFNNLMAMLREIESIQEELKEVEVSYIFV